MSRETIKEKIRPRTHFVEGDLVQDQNGMPFLFLKTVDAKEYFVKDIIQSKIIKLTGAELNFHPDFNPGDVFSF